MMTQPRVEKKSGVRAGDGIIACGVPDRRQVLQHAQ
jgi:hypothetical protein